MPGKRLLAKIAIAGSAIVVGAAEADLARRQRWEIAGGFKRTWRVVSLNPLGALAYFRWGRRP